MKIKILLTLFVLAIIPQSSMSQDVWSLEKCISYALENNIQIKQQELSAKTSEINYTQKRASILPNLNAGANQNFTFGRSVDPFTNEFSSESTQSDNFSISSSVTLFSGLQNVNSIKQSKLNLLAAYENVKKIRNDISLNIASSYLNILFNIELHSIAINQALITHQQLERTKKLVKAGSLPEGNLLDIEAQIASEELQIVNAKNQLDISYLTLKQFLDIDTIDNFQIDIPSNLSIIDSEEDIQEVYDNAVNTLPQIKSAEYMLLSSEKGLSIAKGMISPRLTLSANYGTGYSDARMIPDGDPTMSSYISGYTDDLQNVYTYQPVYNYAVKGFSAQIKDNASTSLAFNLSIPLFNGLQTKTSIDNAKISVLNSQYSLQLTKNQLYKDIQQQYLDIKSALKKYNASNKALSASRLSFNYTQKKHDVGLINITDFNLAKNKLIKAESDFLQAKYEYIFKTKILDFYKGVEIKL